MSNNNQTHKMASERGAPPSPPKDPKENSMDFGTPLSAAVFVFVNIHWGCLSKTNVVQWKNNTKTIRHPSFNEKQTLFGKARNKLPLKK